MLENMLNWMAIEIIYVEFVEFIKIDLKMKTLSPSFLLEKIKGWK